MVTVSMTLLVLVLLPAGSVAAQSVKQTNEKQAFQEELARLRKAEPAEFDKVRHGVSKGGRLNSIIVR